MSPLNTFTKADTKAVPSVGLVVRAGSSINATIFLFSRDALMTASMFFISAANDDSPFSMDCSSPMQKKTSSLTAMSADWAGMPNPYWNRYWHSVKVFNTTVLPPMLAPVIKVGFCPKVRLTGWNARLRCAKASFTCGWNIAS